jgi:cobyrinic acid a,c-diamide synthase
MVGAVEADASMTSRLTLSYRTVQADHDHLLAAGGAQVTGHDFHRTTVEPSHGPAAAWLMDGKPMASPPTRPGSVGRRCTRATCTCIGQDIPTGTAIRERRS